MKTYSEKLKDPRWQKKRLEIMESANWACQVCARKDATLHVHHKAYVSGREPWEYSQQELQCLCEFCHEQKHNLPDVGDVLVPSFLFDTFGKFDVSIRCPVCGFENVHHDSKAIVKDGLDDYKAHPNVRGDVIEIPMWCEEGHTFMFKFGFHKGYTHIWTEYLGPKIHNHVEHSEPKPPQTFSPNEVPF